jgi:hypothetical protein
MLSLEVEGPCGSLSMLVMRRQSGKMPVVDCPDRLQWQQRQTVATGLCRAHLLAVCLRWGLGQGNHGSAFLSPSTEAH